MTAVLRITVLALALCVELSTQAQTAQDTRARQAQMLAAAKPELAANKRLVYDFWREVFEGGHMELAGKYMAETYIQHNPNVPTGRAAFVEFFSHITQPRPVEAQIKAPLVAIVAEGDLVILSFLRQHPDPRDSTQTYTTTWFDMFRIENGKIAEHWDPALRQ